MKIYNRKEKSKRSCCNHVICMSCGMQCVDLITAEMQPMDSPPFYRLVSRSAESGGTGSVGSSSSTSRAAQQVEGETWAVSWRISARTNEGHALPLPAPISKRYFANMKDVLKVPTRQLVGTGIYRSNFALILLSEIVVDVQEVNWSAYLPLLLHAVTLGRHVDVYNDHTDIFCV